MTAIRRRLADLHRHDDGFGAPTEFAAGFVLLVLPVFLMVSLIPNWAAARNAADAAASEIVRNFATQEIEYTPAAPPLLTDAAVAIPLFTALRNAGFDESVCEPIENCLAFTGGGGGQLGDAVNVDTGTRPLEVTVTLPVTVNMLVAEATFNVSATGTAIFDRCRAINNANVNETACIDQNADPGGL